METWGLLSCTLRGHHDGHHRSIILYTVEDTGVPPYWLVGPTMMENVAPLSSLLGRSL